jgi:hypothetical protein
MACRGPIRGGRFPIARSTTRHARQARTRHHVAQLIDAWRPPARGLRGKSGSRAGSNPALGHGPPEMRPILLKRSGRGQRQYNLEEFDSTNLLNIRCFSRRPSNPSLDGLQPEDHPIRPGTVSFAIADSCQRRSGVARLPPSPAQTSAILRADVRGWMRLSRRVPVVRSKRCQACRSNCR